MAVLLSVPFTDAVAADQIMFEPSRLIKHPPDNLRSADKGVWIPFLVCSVFHA